MPGDRKPWSVDARVGIAKPEASIAGAFRYGMGEKWRDKSPFRGMCVSSATRGPAKLPMGRAPMPARSHAGAHRIGEPFRLG